jgi:hypothetical protein
VQKHGRNLNKVSKILRSKINNLDYTTRAPSHSPTVSTDNSTSNISTLHPTLAPVATPWVPVWGWLPGYSGANGPVLRMTGGTDSFSNAIFLVGAFNNYPAVALWFDDPISGI